MLVAGVFDVPGVSNGLGTALIDGKNKEMRVHNAFRCI